MSIGGSIQTAPHPASVARRSVVPLRITLYSRAVAFVRALFPLSLGTGILIAILVASIRSPRPLESLLGAVIVGWQFCLLLVMLGIVMMKTAFVRRPQLRLEERGFVIHHGGIFRLPLAIGWDAVRLVAVEEETPHRRFGRRDGHRFELSGRSPDDVVLPAHLYSRVGGSPFPVLSHVSDPPNVAIIFERPVTLYPTRRTTKVLPVKGPVHIARPRQVTSGVLLRVADPDLARRAFAGHGLVEALTFDHVLSVAPGPLQKERARARNTRANLTVAAIIFLNVAAPIAVEGIGPAEAPAFDGGVLAPMAQAAGLPG